MEQSCERLWCDNEIQHRAYVILNVRALLDLVEEKIRDDDEVVDNDFDDRGQVLDELFSLQLIQAEVNQHVYYNSFLDVALLDDLLQPVIVKRFLRDCGQNRW